MRCWGLSRHIELPGVTKGNSILLMNRYVLFTRDGREFTIAAMSVDVAIAKVEAHAKSVVSCWYLGVQPSRWAIALG